jgi:cysteine desulfurase
MIYLDHAASTPLLPEVRAAMEPFLGADFGNPSSLHAAGRRARKALEDARETVAGCLGADPREIVFTSGATEANHLALHGRASVAATPFEHPSVLTNLRCISVEGGWSVPGAETVSVQWVNHETGTVHPIEAVRKANPKAVFHSDAAQAVGKVPVDLRHVDLLTFSGHKIHGPKGSGGLWVRKGAPLTPLLQGGGQEFERRAGTENVAGAVGLAAAMRIAVRDLEPNARRMAALRARLLAGLGAVREHGGGAPHILNVSFEGIENDRLLMALDAEGVCAASGPACASLSAEPSPVLRAMGVPDELVRSAVRFSVSALTTEAEIDEAARIVRRVVDRLKPVLR